MIEKFYKDNGYVILDLYRNTEFLKIKKFTEDWIKSVVQYGTSKNIKNKNIEKYHLWSKKLKINHKKIFINPNRVIEPNQKIKDLIFTKNLLKIVKKLLKNNYTFWRDPGLGCLCFRFIRPGHADGYHLCKKSWGEAKNVLSAWLPVFGFEQSQMIQFLPGSHKKKIPFVKGKSKFVEPQVNMKYLNSDDLIRPKLKKGQILLYHPGILHSEDVKVASTSRINLEFRFNPKK